MGPKDKVTVDGYDMTWGTNTLGEECSIAGGWAPVLSVLCGSGPFYFTTLLLPALFKASTPENKSRVVNTSSAASIVGVSFFGSGLDFASFKDSHKYKPTEMYGQSKFVRTVVTGLRWLVKLRLFDLQGERGFHPGIGTTPWR